ncbi:MAG: response regulator transcription factor [Kiritimatiellia bacterium]
MNLIVVEADEPARGNLYLLLSGEKSVDRLEMFADVEQAIDNASWEEAHILLLDPDSLETDGLELISWTGTNHSGVTCMVYTQADSRGSVFQAIKAGACGYLLKSSSPRELIESLQELYEGGAPMSPRIARQVINEIHTYDSGKSMLTTRETEILLSLDKGLSYKEIGGRLNISPHTVHTHIKKIYEKVEVGSREEALSKARRLGWI